MVIFVNDFPKPVGVPLATPVVQIEPLDASSSKAMSWCVGSSFSDKYVRSKTKQEC